GRRVRTSTAGAPGPGAGAPARSRDRDGAPPGGARLAPPRQRQARGKGSADIRGRQWDRQSSGGPLRARGRGCRDHLPRRARGRRGDPPPGRRGGAALLDDRRRCRRRELLLGGRRADRHRVGRARRTRQPRRRAARAAALRGHQLRPARAHVPHQRLRRLPHHQGRSGAHPRGRRDSQHNLARRLPGQPDADRLRVDQRRHYRAHSLARDISRGARHSRQRRRARPGLDAADTGQLPCREGRELRRADPDGPHRSAGGDRAELRVPRLERRVVHVGPGPPSQRRHGGQRL
ncbi:MAG: Oxidoreductase, short-chain dehydrogenase/reductase family, partial [uncultured Solirubrobacterales bacterium]